RTQARLIERIELVLDGMYRSPQQAFESAIFIKSEPAVVLGHSIELPDINLEGLADGIDMIGELGLPDLDEMIAQHGELGGHRAGDLGMTRGIGFLEAEQEILLQTACLQHVDASFAGQRADRIGTVGTVLQLNLTRGAEEIANADHRQTDNAGGADGGDLMRDLDADAGGRHCWT